MRAIITITEMKSMPGRFEASIKTDDFKRGRISAGYGASEAAAVAMELAIQHGQSGYHVFGSKKVLELIPDDMQRSNG